MSLRGDGFSVYYCGLDPELKIENGEYALKASGYFSAFDISLYGFYGFEKTPTLSYTGNNPNVYSIPESITVNGSYKRMTMIGLDTAFPIGELVIRAEGAYFPEREMQSSATSIPEYLAIILRLVTLSPKALFKAKPASLSE